VKGAIQSALPQIVEITIHIEPAYPPPGVAAIRPKPAAAAARRKD
jgi:hypothetical protein